MRILIIQPWLSYRGAETLSINQARGLQRLGHDVKIIGLWLDWRHLDIAVKEVAFITPGRRVSQWCQRSNVFLFAFGFLAMIYLLLEYGKEYDIFNPHNFPSVWAAVLVGKIYRKKVIWTVHNFPQHGFAHPMVKKIWEWGTWWLDQAAVRNVEKIVAVSAKVSRQVSRFYQREAKVLNPGIDIDFFTQANSALGRKIIKAKGQYIICPAVLSTTKNQALLLQALKHVSGVNLVIAGEGREKKRLRQLTRRLGLAPRVLFLGYVPKEQLRHLYAAALLLVCPGSYGEGFNLTVIEGLACGTVPVVVEGSGVDEWVSRYQVGWVAKQDALSLAATLKEAVRSVKQRKQKLVKGRRIVRQKHTLESYTRYWLAGL